MLTFLLVNFITPEKMKKEPDLHVERQSRTCLWFEKEKISLALTIADSRFISSIYSHKQKSYHFIKSLSFYYSLLFYLSTPVLIAILFGFKRTSFFLPDVFQ